MASLYLNKKKDADLYGLLVEVGSDRFCKIAKACLRALFDDKQADLARSMATEGIKEEGTQGEYHDAGVLFRISTTARKDEHLKTIIASLAPGVTSTFVKTTMRQVLGPQILLKYLLLPGATVLIEEVKPMLFVRMKVEEPEMKKTKVRRRKRSVQKKRPVQEKPIQMIQEHPVQKQQEVVVPPSNKKVVAVELSRDGSVTTVSDYSAKESVNGYDNANNVNKVDQAVPEESGTPEMDILSMLEAML